MKTASYRVNAVCEDTDAAAVVERRRRMLSTHSEPSHSNASEEEALQVAEFPLRIGECASLWKTRYFVMDGQQYLTLRTAPTFGALEPGVVMRWNVSHNTLVQVQQLESGTYDSVIETGGMSLPGTALFGVRSGSNSLETASAVRPLTLEVELFGAGGGAPLLQKTA
eukprot:1455093-Rhodomonas_salina.1